ncbi:MAG: cytochrome P450 [Microthrixaceae bacterium]
MSAGGAVAPRPTSAELTAAAFDEDVARSDPYPTYARLRAEAPVVWHEDPGIWLVSRYDDVLAVNRDTQRFSSTGGVIPIEIGIDYPSPPTMMHTDPPEHTRLRRAVARGFRPSRIAALEARIADHVSALVEAIPTGEPFDAVDALAAPLPITVICELLDLPSADWASLRRASDAVIPGAGDFSDEERAELNARLEELLRQTASSGGGLAADLREAGMDAEETYILVNQVLVAGNETTRNLLAGGLVAFSEAPSQWTRVVEDDGVVPAAVEEMLRFTTPVVSFMRTATCEVTLGGEQLRAGDPVLMLWASANRDESEFGPDADSFVVDRHPNHHLAFGFGAHFCVGAALARLEARLVLEALRQRFSTIEAAGSPVRSPSTVIAGYERVPLVGS